MRREQLAWLLLTVLGRPALAQHAEPSPQPATPVSTGASGDHRVPAAPTHAPQPVVPPLLLFEHVQNANTAVARAIADRQPLQPPGARPAGAGRYLCAVVVCADADVDMPTLLGMHRHDVLLISTPGPFVLPEAVALLERAVREDRLGLILLVGHDGCRTLQPLPPGQPADALSRRSAAVVAEAERRRLPLTKAFLQMQREHLVAASDLLRRRLADDTLRIMPTAIDPRTGRCTWLHQAIDAMPLAPVR